jgi:YesN/AraC family two-component response regulator
MTDLTNATTFQERMFERVRESLSELLTAEEAKALVEKAIEQSLFQQEMLYDSYKSRQIGVKPSRFEALVKEAVEPAIKTAVTEWLAEHHEEVKASIQGVVEQGIASTVVKVFQDEMRQPFWEMGGKLQQVINKLGGIQ